MKYNNRLFRLMSVFLTLMLIVLSLPHNILSHNPVMAAEEETLRIPVITGFSPVQGKPGESITITGGNFTPNHPGDTAVDFNGVPAEVLSLTENETVVVIPEESFSGPITVRTPGGCAVSSRDFIVTFLRKIQMELPGSFNSQDFTIINAYGSGIPDENGRVEILSNDQDINFNCTVLTDQNFDETGNLSDERTFFQVDLLEESPGDKVTMNSLSTAKGMVFLSPLLFTPRIEQARIIMETIDDDPKVAVLAQVIEEVFPDTLKPLDDSRVKTALEEAIDSVLGRLPEIYSPDLAFSPLIMDGQGYSEQITASAASPSISENEPAVRVFREVEEELDIYWKPIDLYMMKYSLDGPGRLRITAVGDNPVDWYLRMVELDPAQFSGGMKSIIELPTRDGNTVIADGCGGWSVLGGEQPTQLVFSSSWFKNLDLVGRAAKWVYAPTIAEKPVLPFDPDRDAIYVVRMYNPVLIWMWDTAGTEWGYIPTLTPNGATDALKSHALNVFMAVLDSINILVKVDDILSPELVVKLFVKTEGILAAKFADGFEGLSKTEFMARTIEAFGEIMAATVKMVAMNKLGGVNSELEKKATHTTGESILGGILSSVKILDKISTLGAFGARAAYMTTGTGLGYSMSPLETLIFVVGDPFSPKISGFTPGEGIPGDQVTINGVNFNTSPTSNEVLFGSVSARVITATGSQLVVEVPEEAVPGKTQLKIKTAKGWNLSTTEFRVIRQPVISSVTPECGFLPVSDFPSAGKQFPGSRIIIEGKRFDPSIDCVKIGGVNVSSVDMTRSSTTRLEVDVPPGCVGGPIQVTTPENKTAAGPGFTILGSPVLQQSTFTLPAGMPLNIPVVNLSGNPAEVKVDIVYNASLYQPIYVLADGAEAITVRIPLSIPEGQVRVTTPAGSSTADFSFPEDLGKVYQGTISVNTYQDDFGGDPGHLSLHEAVATAGGQYTLWDDFDDEYDRDTWVEIRTGEDPNYEYTWTLVSSNPEPAAPQPGAGLGHNGHEIRKVYDIKKYHQDNGGETVRLLVDTIDLDSGVGDQHQPEEADMLEGYEDAEYPASQNTVDNIILSHVNATPGIHILGTDATLLLSTLDDITAVSNPVIIDAVSSTADPLFELSNRNRVRFNTGWGHGLEIRNAAGTVFRLGSGANGNVIQASIDNAGGIGIHIGPGAYSNTIGDGHILGTGGTGILITGEGSDCNIIKGNSSGVFVGGWVTPEGIVKIDGSDTGWGIEISNGASNNIIDGTTKVISVMDNFMGGILVTGNGTNHNWIEGYHVGYLVDYSPNPDVFIPAGNGGNGIMISDGARYTYLGESNSVSTIGCNEGDGLVITGEGTYGTIVSNASLHIGYYPNAGINMSNANGIRISDGATGIMIESVHCRGNTGYGLIIEGQNTHDILVQNSNMGGIPLWMGGKGPSGLGGMIIRDGAYGNTITSVWTELVLGNAVVLSNCGDEIEPNRVWSNTMIMDGAAAIRAEAGAHHNIVGMNRLNNYGLSGPLGIIVTGTGTSYNRFLFNRILQPGVTGMLVENNADFNTLDSNYVFGSGGDGVIIDNSDDTWLYTMCVEQNLGNGIIIRNGADNTCILSPTPPTTFTPTQDPWEMPDSPVRAAWTEIKSNSGHGILVDTLAQNTLIRGVAIYNNGGDGILIQGEGTGLVEISECLAGIMLESDNQACVSGNAGNGIHIADGAGQVIIGGESIESGNVISANTQNGILVSGNCSGVDIINNFIGTSLNGTQSWGNGSGISIIDSSQVTIGALKMGNLISGNCGDGINISGADNIGIYNNTVGLNFAGNTRMENCGSGIRIEGGTINVTIGDELDGMRNIISGNTGDGIIISGDLTANIIISGNYIGTDITGATALGNQGNGIILDNGLKNTPVGPANLIGGNGLSGIKINGAGTDNNRIFGNLVGVNLNQQALGNGEHGIVISGGASLNRIYKNIIWNNPGSGVSVGTGSGQNIVTGCSITGNGAGITLEAGANNDIPEPKITYYRSGLIQGEVDVSIPDRCPVEIFADTVAQGMIPLGITYVERSRFVLRVPLPADMKATAAVTDFNGNTSEFGGFKPRVLPPLVGYPVSQVTIPDKVRTVFSSTSEGNSNIYCMDGVITGARPLTSTPEADYSPSISADGTRIVFVSERDGNPEIYSVNTDGSNMTRLTYDGAGDYDPSWSPDGRRIVFVSERNGNPDIYTMNSDGTNLTVLLSDTAVDYCPEWSNDGTRIAFTSDRDGNEEIYICNADGTEIKRITENPSRDYQPAFSTYDTELVFISERDGNPELYTVNIYGMKPVRLTSNSAIEGNPSWLFGTCWISFEADYNGESEIYAVSSDGKNLRRITVRTNMNVEPDWTLVGVIPAEPGDANIDGTVNVLDITRIARVILYLDTKTPGADANQDGIVNVLDMTKIARYILGLE